MAVTPGIHGFSGGAFLGTGARMVVKQTDGETTVTEEEIGGQKEYTVGLDAVVKSDIAAAKEHAETAGNPHNTQMGDIQGLNAKFVTERTAREAVEAQINLNLAAETLNRSNGDIALQTQIDAIVSRSDVVDVVASHAELESYDTSTLGDNDVIKVLEDETQDDAESYYRWNLTTQTWGYIGSQGPFVTPSEMQTALNGKVDKVSGKGLSTNDYTTAEKDKLAGIETGANKTVVDSALNTTSTNPVQNKVVKDAIDKSMPYIIDAASATTAIFDEAVSRYNAGKLVFILKGVYLLQCVGASSTQMLFESVAGGANGISKGVITWYKSSGSVPAITWLNAAARDGSDATGTWGIDISGNAATANSATSATSADNLSIKTKVSNVHAVGARLCTTSTSNENVRTFNFLVLDTLELTRESAQYLVTISQRKTDANASITLLTKTAGYPNNMRLNLYENTTTPNYTHEWFVASSSTAQYRRISAMSLSNGFLDVITWNVVLLTSLPTYTSSFTCAEYAEKPSSFVEDNLVSFDSTGNLKDSGVALKLVTSLPATLEDNTLYVVK